MALKLSYDEKKVVVLYADVEALSLADTANGTALIVSVVSGPGGELRSRLAFPIGVLKDLRDFYDIAIATRPELIAEMDG